MLCKCFVCSFDPVGQAGAIRHALSNALAAFSDDYYQTLEKGTTLLIQAHI